MQVIVHYPKDESKTNELAVKVAIFHAYAILHKLQTSPLPKDKRNLLIKEIAQNAEKTSNINI